MKLFIFTLAFLVISTNATNMQRVIVKGRLLCGSSPATDVQLKLFNENFGFDDLLNTKRTNATGHFVLDGFKRETSNIDPLVKIYHDCDDSMVCQRRLMLYVPKKYINFGEGTNTETNIEALKQFDIGTMNLEAYVYGEDRDCFHKK